jgi:hypothetical protein
VFAERCDGTGRAAMVTAVTVSRRGQHIGIRRGTICAGTERTMVGRPGHAGLPMPLPSLMPRRRRAMLCRIVCVVFPCTAETSDCGLGDGEWSGCWAVLGSGIAEGRKLGGVLGLG